MPTIVHEGILQPFQHRPALAAELLVDAFGVQLPSWQQAVLADTNLTEPVPAEYLADTVIVLYDWPDRPANRRRKPRRNPKPSAGTPAGAIVVEVQLQYDPRKAYTWPAYLTNQRARIECPVTLLVVCPDPSEVARCAQPIDTGHPGWILRPLVMGPDQIPVVTDPVTARQHPDLTVLSALAHAGTHPDRDQVLVAFTEAVQNVEPDQASVYHELVYATLPAAARRFLEELMGTITIENLKLVSPMARTFAAKGKAEGLAEGQAKGKTEGRAEGRAEALAEAVLAVLDCRGIAMSDWARDRITVCTDFRQLDIWIRRAATVTSIRELFTD